jgi:hypothetical protein
VSDLPMYTLRSSLRAAYRHHGYSTQIPRFQVRQLILKSRQPGLTQVLHSAQRHQTAQGVHFLPKTTPPLVDLKLPSPRTPSFLQLQSDTRFRTTLPRRSERLFMRSLLHPREKRTLQRIRMRCLARAHFRPISPPGILVGALSPRYDHRCMTSRILGSAEQ